ncbi:hypothetical protein KHA90_16735 [Flavobacterium psychroterrae]|jgi:hypothetical protein|uniref:Beta-carotene 15,15'-monooxygenase n=1 Tax=Flavobacterium psychroterrae TaxID=2133767 RepID=A0ABS5PEW7_9FLAO|nr:hypothetical protein [Flavobacterium psychroterrae]MBS7232666.1 hypothetical protein [Flavobacterium psychroterrae]
MKSGINKGYLIVLVYIMAIVCFSYIIPEYGMISIAAPLYITGLFCYIFGRKWNSTNLGRETGKEVNFKKSHSLLFIKMQYWAIPFIFFATLLLTKAINQVDDDLYLIIQNVAFILFFSSLIFVFIQLIEKSKYKRYFIILWSGKGYLIFVVFLVTFIGFTFLFTSSKYTVAAPFYITAFFCFIFGKITTDKVSKTIINLEKDEELSFKTNDSLFLIKMKYWTFIFIVFAIILTFSSSTKTSGSSDKIPRKNYFNENF